VRLHEASKKLNIDRKNLVMNLTKLGFPIKDHPFSVVTEEMLAALDKQTEKKDKAPSVKAPEASKEAVKIQAKAPSPIQKPPKPAAEKAV